MWDAGDGSWAMLCFGESFDVFGDGHGMHDDRLGSASEERER